MPFLARLGETMEKQREFKGVWIPAEIWLDKRLNALDKVILSEIDSLDATEDGCYASNEYIADFCDCSASKVSSSISKLIKYDFLYVKKFDGRIRYLKSNIRRQTSKICKADYQNLEEININNNNICPSKDEQDKSSLKEKELADNFDKIWKIYPRKESKSTAFTHYKAWLNGKKYAGRIVKLNNRQMWLAVKKYADLMEKNKTEKQYIKMGSTFFNEAIMEYVEEEKVEV